MWVEITLANKLLSPETMYDLIERSMEHSLELYGVSLDNIDLVFFLCFFYNTSYNYEVCRLFSYN